MARTGPKGKGAVCGSLHDPTWSRAILDGSEGNDTLPGAGDAGAAARLIDPGFDMA